MYPANRLVLPALLAAATAFAAPPVLRVNGEDVPRFRFEFAKRAIAEQSLATAPAAGDLASRAVDQLIVRSLLLQAAREAKVEADPAAVKKALELQRAQFASREEFEKMLAELSITEADLAMLEEERQMIQRLVETTVSPGIVVSEEEGREFVAKHPDEFKHPEEVKVRMILVHVAEGADEKAQAVAKGKVEEAARRVAGGEDFAKVAGQVSEDRSKDAGGEVGWVRRGMLLPELDGPVFALKPGDLTPVLKSKYGFHVLRVDDRRTEGSYAFAEVKDRVIAALKGRKVRAAVQQLVHDRRAVARIEALDPDVKAALAAGAAGGPDGAAVRPSRPPSSPTAPPAGAGSPSVVPPKG